MNRKARQEALRFLFEPVIEKLGYKFTPSQEDADFLLEQETLIEAATGIPYCPCQARSNNRAENMRMVCPCIPFHRRHYDAMRRCWCGLFVHKDVTDPDTLRQFPEKEHGTAAQTSHKRRN
ncbi:MAG: ferredoxin:thioredoxin reductase [Elusimicrobia bacterium RIFOXYA2_FULL_58_8]|nr:MAG: ferredoxin:thioredoxin reductase [Elusimicrobia bacterium RIFOXYA2_FULL_58_8]OGS14452.1 MAG: ferredoxin:thioredoxin reductase [Elusimicrobia bacterium RIFOXYA12_FULL_57_11]